MVRLLSIRHLIETATRVAWTIFFMIVLIELAVRFRAELSPVWEYLLGPTILYG